MSDARHTLPDVRARLLQHGLRRSPAVTTRCIELFEPPFKGRLARETVEHTKRILAIVIAFGGQWPHSTYMMPGGVTCALDEAKLAECDAAIDGYRGLVRAARCSAARARSGWRSRRPRTSTAWLEAPAHRDSALGVFARFARSIGLDRAGRAARRTC